MRVTSSEAPHVYQRETKTNYPRHITFTEEKDPTLEMIYECGPAKADDVCLTNDDASRWREEWMEGEERRGEKRSVVMWLRY